VVTNNQTTRLSAFFDAGNVFARPGDFRLKDLRTSTGIAFTFFTPFLGLLKVSYAFPLNAKPQDDTKRFQISFGTGF
jgi:outer membrane protein insertion porin family